MKQIVLLLAVFAMMLGKAQAQTKDEMKLPNNWILQEDEPVRYIMTTTHYDYKTLGPFFSRTVIQGTYTRGFANGNVQWSDVSIGKSNEISGPVGETNEISAMEDFTYQPGVHMVDADAFPGLPNNQNLHLLRNLVWDMMGIEYFAWGYIDQMELNKEIVATQSNLEVELAGEGSFQNKEIRLTWLGMTEKNGAQCAIVKFSVLNNPLKVKTPFMDMKGRSHYWGNVYVNVSTKQMEYAELYEDVLMKIIFEGNPEVQDVNTVRTIFVEKVLNR